ncbi:M16 family metallopeptidase [Anditalea andensis]|uniref:Peptidase M16 n=1 Tax=Anditalea andensis TaxID=1048983 RepID=A0A074L2Z1_9BACT|nr:M16 family metallopeptidase [Anditalea andensis]KEO74233.1 hypothetical protein EL17_08860 [Anditalea andensis]
MIQRSLSISIQKFLHPLLFLLACQQVAMGQNLSTTSFTPADLRSGILENGMKYYIMENNEPPDRAAFYFAQNVGSILEEDHQRGLAHFLEHMAFNGTEHFSDKALLDYLQKNGIKFGYEINAFTDYDETVYSIRNVPVHNNALLDSVLLILFDWSAGLTLSAKEIDKERGVVREEWRSRYNPVKRADDTVKIQGLLKDSRYALRSPIGTMEVIDLFEYQDLKTFYNNWYRPDLQAVIVVGAIDSEEMEQKVKRLFSKLPIPDNPPNRPVFEVPTSDEFIYLTVADKELGTTEIDYFIKNKIDPSLNEKEVIEKNLKFRIISSLVNQRLHHIMNAAPVPALSVRFGLEKVVRPLEVIKISIHPKKGEILQSLEFALTELSRWMNHGATDQEFDRIKTAMIRSTETSLKSGKGRSSVYSAIKLYEAFFKDHKMADYHWELQYELDYLSALTREDLLEEFADYYKASEHIVAIKGSDSSLFPTEQAIVDLLEKLKVTPLDPYQDINFDRPLMDLVMEDGKVVSEEIITGTDGVRYTLSNGARVSLFPPPAKDEGVHFKAFSPGGRSVLDKELLTNSLFAPMFASESGLANLNKMELRKSEEVVPLDIKIEDHEETLTGYVTGKNLQALFKGIYLSFTAPRFDQQIFETAKQNLASLYATMESNIQNEFIENLQLAKSNYSEREVHLNNKLLDELSMEAIETVYRDRINNAADFDFVFMGEVDREQFLSLIKKYIGSIPGNKEREMVIDHDMIPERGIDRVHLRRPMKTPQATVNVYITGDMEYTHENQLALNILGQLLAKRYMESIREEEGGTYGVRVNAVLQQNPQDAFILNISFNGNPDMTERLLEIVYQELENLSHTLDQAAFYEIKSSLKKGIEENKSNSRRHFEKILQHLYTGMPLLTFEMELDAVDAITDKEILKLAFQINSNPRIIEGVLLPSE